MAKPAAQHKGDGKGMSINTVSEQAQWGERIKKEMRYYKVYDSYHVNPTKPSALLTGKPNSLYDNVELDTTEDGEQIRQLMAESQKPPTQKYTYPVTSSMEYGWISKPLLEVDKSDIRLYHGKLLTDITKSKEAEWRHGSNAPTSSKRKSQPPQPTQQNKEQTSG